MNMTWLTPKDRHFSPGITKKIQYPKYDFKSYQNDLTKITILAFSSFFSSFKDETLRLTIKLYKKLTFFKKVL